MEKTFRDYHLFEILNSPDFGSIPLDVQLGQYFRDHRAIGSKDRKCIAEKIYKMVRWLGLVDYFCKGSHTWEERFNTLKTLDIPKSSLDPMLPPHIRCSFPKYLFELLLDYYGEEKTLDICLASNLPAPTTVRVNSIKTTRSALIEKLGGNFSITKTEHSEWGINFRDRVNFRALDEFKEGLFEVQDEGSQLVASLVAAKPGDLILDYCAGAGGKTLSFAPKLEGKGQIYLHDIRERPLIEAKKRLKRAGIENGQILPSDAPHLKSLKGKMDWVLVDLPCSGSGTLRRNPDLKWKFSPEMLKRLIQQQREIFSEALSFLSPKGKIVYATCSILSQENEDQIKFFIENHDLELVAPPFNSLPTKGGMDGFFGAVLQRLEK